MTKIVVITGSTRGIGFALAKKFLQYGHSVIINGRTTSSVALAIKALKQIAKNVFGVAGDVSRLQTHQNILNKAQTEFGRIDIWINNAAIPQTFDFFLNLPINQIEKLIQTNILGVILGTRIAAEFMTKQGFGAIYNMNGFGSDGKIKPRLVIYGTSKKAVDYFTRAFYYENKNLPIQVGVINPGMVKTDFLKLSLEGLPKEFVEKNRKFNEHFASDPDDVAEYIVRKILSAKSKFIQINYLNIFKIVYRLAKYKILS